MLGRETLGTPVLSAAPEGRGIRVLAAEDHPVFQSMLRSMLAKWGYDSVIARDGLEAWRTLDSEDAPRLATLDWMMPGVDGVEICRRVRAAAREPCIYLVLLTARSESQDLVEGMEAGRMTISRSPSWRTNCACVCAPDGAFSTSKRSSWLPGKRFASRPLTTLSRAFRTAPVFSPPCSIRFGSPPGARDSRSRAAQRSRRGFAHCGGKCYEKWGSADSPM
jgi:CheY-like chemotaxis protein